MANGADLVYAAREHLERTFRSGELVPNRRRQTDWA